MNTNKRKCAQIKENEHKIKENEYKWEKMNTNERKQTEVYINANKCLCGVLKQS